MATKKNTNIPTGGTSFHLKMVEKQQSKPGKV